MHTALWRHHPGRTPLRPPPAAGGGGPAAVGGTAGLELAEDLQEVWAERVAIMEWDGRLPRAVAERLAWVGLQSQGEAR